MQPLDRSKLVITDKHYCYNQKKYDRVSNYTGFQGGKWMIEARDRGKALHYYLEQLHKKGLSRSMLSGIKAKNEDMYNIVIAYQKFAKRKKIEAHFVEEPILSDKLLVGGTPDIYCDIDGKKNVLCDFKSGQYYKSYMCQFGAYRQILKENGIVPKYYAIIFLKAAGVEMKYIATKDITLGYSAWIGCLNYYRSISAIQTY